MTIGDHKAVFLSYASEDAAAARRIADALGGEGIEVWLDQSELRGGDAWDASIRAKIRDCALFIPIISASTEARGEGYFRLEWRLAVDRSQLMADDQPFLVPVAIDKTPESSARVPDAFRARHWMRLRDGMPSAEFAAQVKRLLGTSAPGGDEPRAVRPAVPRTRTKMSPGGIIGILIALVMLVAVGGYYATKKEAPPSVAEAPVAKASAVVAAASPNSIAVLPFANLSDDKQNEYFSDGISEELLTVLQKVSALQVAARSSSFAFKGSNATAQEIGRKLGVSHLVEGSVRKAGHTVRITARLSRAANGEQLWSDGYTRDLKDVFAVQSELAQTIVEQLRGRLDAAAIPSGKGEIQAQVAAAVRGGTRNTEAHQLYLQGLFYINQYSLAASRKACDFLERAVALDPQFALAWAALSRAAAQRGGIADTRAEFEKSWTTARGAADRALAIDGSLVSAQLALMGVQIWHDFDWKGAAESLARARSTAPTDAEVLEPAAMLAYATGRTEAAARLAEQAVVRDPLNAETRTMLGFALVAMNRHADAVLQFRRVNEINPDAPWGHAGVGYTLLLQNRLDEALTEASRETTEWSRLTVNAQVLWSLGKRAEADAALARLVSTDADIAAIQISQIYAHRGDKDRAFEWLERSYRQRDPGIAWIKADRQLTKQLGGDPRWENLLRKMNLTDDQLKSLP